MKVVIIEDEKLAAERLAGLISEVDPEIEIMKILGSVRDSVKWLTVNKPDLIFLDIQLSDGLSFSIFEQIKTNIPIIFTTAYDQYAIKAFKLNSVDYLLKPVRKSELEESLSKFKEIKQEASLNFEKLLSALKGKEPAYKKRFLVNFGQKIKNVETEEAAYFYAIDKNVFLTTFDNHMYPVDFTLEKLCEVLDPEKFFRINRKIVINYDAIKNMVPYSRSRIRIDLNPPSPKDIDALVSVERAADFKKWLDK